MRVSLSLRASPSTVGTQSLGLRGPPPALLPPIPLYRRLLRCHRTHLPPRMRLLGDEYIKSEFRAHRDIDNPVHIVSCLLLYYVFVFVASCMILVSCSLRSPFQSTTIYPHDFPSLVDTYSPAL